MSDIEKAATETQLAKDAYKCKDLDGAVSHYLTAAELDPEEMSFVYHVANIKFEQEKFAECVKFYTKAIKVGKEYKANVKMVTKAMAMRGKAYKQLGEMDKFKEDLEKAVKFLFTIARVKFEKQKYGECMTFSERAIEMSEENGVTINKQIMALKSAAEYNITMLANIIQMGEEACEKKDFDLMMWHFNRAYSYDEESFFLPLKCAKMLYNQGEFSRCYEFLERFVDLNEEDPEHYKQDEVDEVRALQGKALRRMHGFDETFDTKPWLEFVEEDTDEDSFATLEDLGLKSILGDKRATLVFRMADFDGDGRATLEDALYVTQAMGVPKEERAHIDFGTLVPRNSDPEEGRMDVIDACLKTIHLDK